ncbi:NAD-dependent epimerase/dehydratase family protein [Streptomyces sp. NPDC053069]|uniref:NAD-dependent epimerase/dehydratase family protein n=1 Tax=Streptomyces sp. NPDC053069 TaxID=3365695 RepID=UPI0037D3A18A
MSLAGRPRRVAVLGATGCVGRHVCAAFAERGADVVAIARRPAPHIGPYPFRSLDAGRLTGGELAAVLAESRVDTVVNAMLGWGRSAREMDDANVRPVERLLAALRALPDPVRYVHLGTIHEYGPIPYGTAVDETAEPRPTSLYARSKLTASRLVLDAAARGELDAVVLRLTNTLGPYTAPESFFGALAARLRRAAAAPGEVTDVAVAAAHRDFVDVRDAAAAVYAAAAGAAPERLLNIGRGEAVAVETLVRTLVEVSGLPPDAVRIRHAEVRSRSAGADWIQVDPSRARQSLGWRPGHLLTDALRAVWRTVEPAPPVPLSPR